MTDTPKRVSDERVRSEIAHLNSYAALGSLTTTQTLRLDILYDLLAERAANAKLREERDEARKFGEMAAKEYNDLLIREITCAFCGHVYPKDTPASGARILAEHITTCVAHPMRALEAELTRLRAATVPIWDVEALAHTIREAWDNDADWDYGKLAMIAARVASQHLGLAKDGGK